MVIITRFLEVIAAHLLGHEISAWFPKFAACLVRLAVNRLPERQRTRYLEEWQSHLEEIPGSIGKCVEALGFYSPRSKFPAIGTTFGVRQQPSRFGS